MFKLLPVFGALLLSACASNSSPPASSPPPSTSVAEPRPAGAAEGQSETKERDDLKGELSAVNDALTDLSKRLEVAKDAVKADLQQQLAALQMRYDGLKAQVNTTGASAEAKAKKARREIHQAIMDLRSDMQRLTDRIQR